MNVLDDALERAQAFQRERQGGQKTLFDLLGRTSVKKRGKFAEIKLPDCPPWDEKTILKYEKEALGFYVSSHPMNLYKERLKHICTGTSQDIESMPDGTEVVLAGIISIEKEITTKKGEKMAFLQLEDKEGIVELVAFPEVYSAFRERFYTDDEPVIVIGTLQNQAEGFDVEEGNGGSDEGQQGSGWSRRNNAKVIVKEFLDMEEAERRAVDRLVLRLKADNVRRDDLFRLRNLVIDHKGNCPLFVKLDAGSGVEAVILLGDEYRVNPSRVFIEDVKKFFGANSLEVIYSVGNGL